VTHSRPRSGALRVFHGPRIYLWLSGIALLLALVSLHWPSTPSYDPWSWLIWGREIFHALTGTGPAVDGSLHIAGGSSWKPLPVIFTTVFALFGSAQPNLWLLVARAGAVLTVLMSVKLTVRATWGLVSQSRPGIRLIEHSAMGRTVALTPAVLAGAAALVCTALTRRFPGNMMLGYSEGVMTAVFLIALERAWDGHPRQAFALGIVPCLDRPELWPIWGLFGLWLIWRDRGARLLVVGLGGLMLALWVVPQKLGHGSGGILGLATHAQKNHSAASAVNSTFPFWTELSRTLWPLIIERLEFAALILIAVSGFWLARSRRRLGGWSAAGHRHPAALATALLGLLGFLWWLGIAAETQAGFAGNPRYAVIGVMCICVCGCAAYGWACIGLAALVDRALRWLRRRLGARSEPSGRPLVWLTSAATLLLLVTFTLVPDLFTNRMPTIPALRYQLRYQAQLRERFASLITGAGGPGRIIGCGSVMTDNYEVTMLAWYLQVPIPYVQALTHTPQVQKGPNVIFRTASSTGAAVHPGRSFMRDWVAGWKQANGSRYAVTAAAPVTVYMDCSSYSQT
jgi:hypothetical protein